MTAIETIKDGSTSYMTIDFHGSDGVTPTSPISATWELIDRTSNTVVQVATPITPIAATVTITIPSSLNTMLNQYIYREYRRVIVRATYGVDDVIVESYDYIIINEER